MHVKAKRNKAAVYKTGSLSGKPYDKNMGCSCEPSYFYVKAIETGEVLWYTGNNTQCCNDPSLAKHYRDRKTAQKISNELQEKRKCDSVVVHSSTTIL